MPRKLSHIAPDWWNYITFDSAVTMFLLAGRPNVHFNRYFGGLGS